MSLLYTWLPKIIRCIRNGVWQIYFFVVLDHFSPFTPQTTLKNKIWKNIKNTWRYHSFINVHQKWRSYDKWFLRYKAQCIEFFFVILGFLLPFDLPNNPKTQNFKKKEKKKIKPGDIIILHLCITNIYHIMHGYWAIEHNIICFLHFRPLFFFLPHEQPKKIAPWTTQKIKILKKWKKNTHRYCHFIFVHHKWQSYDVPFLRYGSPHNFLPFWTIFCPFTPITPQKSKWKNEKTACRYCHFTHMHHKWQSYDVSSLRYGARQTTF